MLRNLKLRYLALFGAGLCGLCSFFVVLASPSADSEPTPVPVPLTKPEPSNIMLLEANACGEDIVGETSDQIGQQINFTRDGRFPNDEARSLVLMDVKPGMQLRLFDDADADFSDDWVKVFVKQETGIYCVPSFERTYEDDVVQVTYHQINGLDGKVSLMVVEQGSYVALPGTDPTALPPPPQDTPTITPLPTATSSPVPTVPVVAGSDCIPVGTLQEIGIVTRIVDGDTIDVSIAGVEYRVRYIGMDTPEVGDTYFDEATAKNSELLEEQTVTLIKDVSETDIYGRILRYVISDNQFVNYELVRQGYAVASTYPPDVACSNTYADAQNLAASSGMGLWGIPPTPVPTQAPIPTQPPAATQSGSCHPSYPTVCIPYPPPDLNCGDITHRRFQVVGSDPHGFDGDDDGVGCESG